MKRFMTILAVALATLVSLTACNDTEPQTVDVRGTWYYGSRTSDVVYDYTQLVLGRDMTYVSNHTRRAGDDDAGDDDITIGTWGVSGHDIILYPGGELQLVYTLDGKKSTQEHLVLDGPDGPVDWYRSLSSLH